MFTLSDLTLSTEASCSRQILAVIQQRIRALAAWLSSTFLRSRRTDQWLIGKMEKRCTTTSHDGLVGHDSCFDERDDVVIGGVEARQNVVLFSMVVRGDGMVWTSSQITEGTEPEAGSRQSRLSSLFPVIGSTWIPEQLCVERAYWEKRHALAPATGLLQRQKLASSWKLCKRSV
jgi:hypothetical protein